MTPNKLRECAIFIIEELTDVGFTAYFAGGYVRDLLLGIESHEIDIATSASPEQVMALFPKTVAVGAKFGVVIVVIEGQSFEVASFRRDGAYIDGRRPTIIHYSSAEEDAQRRDFTINGMFYDPKENKVIDYVGGQQDLKTRVVRAIGNPKDRFAEDRLRMIRAVRFATRFSFRLEDETKHAIEAAATTLFPSVSMERIWQEFIKMCAGPNPGIAFTMLHRLRLLPTIFPDLESVSIEEIEKRVEPFERYPKHCPAIFYLHAVVPEMGLDICPYLKTSKHDVKLLDIVSEYPQTESRVEWAYYYAENDVWTCLEVLAATNPPDFLRQHEKRFAMLQKHVTRIENRTPVVTSALLKELDVKPSPQMGEILRKAERISIEEDLDDPNEVLKKLDLGI